MPPCVHIQAFGSHQSVSVKFTSLRGHAVNLQAFQADWPLACILCRLWRVVNNAELAHSPLLLAFLELSEAVRVIPQQQQPSPSRKSISEAKPAAVRFPSSCSRCCTRPHRICLGHSMPHKLILKDIHLARQLCVCVHEAPHGPACASPSPQPYMLLSTESMLTTAAAGPEGSRGQGGAVTHHRPEQHKACGSARKSLQVPPLLIFSRL